MKLLMESISVKNFGANAQKFYLIHFWNALNSRNTYTTMQYLVLFLVKRIPCFNVAGILLDRYNSSANRKK
jgi:hypothetical protein